MIYVKSTDSGGRIRQRGVKNARQAAEILGEEYSKVTRWVKNGVSPRGRKAGVLDVREAYGIVTREHDFYEGNPPRVTVYQSDTDAARVISKETGHEISAANLMSVAASETTGAVARGKWAHERWGRHRDVFVAFKAPELRVQIVCDDLLSEETFESPDALAMNFCLENRQMDSILARARRGLRGLYECDGREIWRITERYVEA